MKNITLLFCVLFCTKCITAQDIIYLKNGRQIQAKVIEVKSHQIKYHRFDNADGPVYHAIKLDVDSILYENGSKDVFDAMPPGHPRNHVHHPNITPDNPEFTGQGSNLVSSGIWLFDNVSRLSKTDPLRENEQPVTAAYFSYEKMFAKEHLSLSVSPFIGLNRKAYGATLGFQFYPKPAHRALFHLGPELSVFRRQYITKLYYPEGYYKIDKGMSTMKMATFNLGVNIHTTPKWLVTTNMGIGGILSNSQRRKMEDKQQVIYDSYYGGTMLGDFFEDAIYNFRIGLSYRFN